MITIVDDTQLEEDEFFSIELQSTIEQLFISPSNATVYIINNEESMLVSCLCSYIITYETILSSL